MEMVPKNAGARWTSWTLEADYKYLYERLLADTFYPLDNKSKKFLFTIEVCLSVWQIILRQFILHNKAIWTPLWLKRAPFCLNLKNAFK